MPRPSQAGAPGRRVTRPGRAGRGVVSRRGLLRMGGAVGVSAALAACTTRSSPAASGTKAATPTAPGVRVAVIGAGLAGTTAAYRLARSGVRVRLFEARDRIGGRCWTARGFADGQTAEHGGEFIDTRHVHLRGLATELGLQLDDLWQGDVPDAISPSWINGGYFDYYDKFYAQLDRITTAVKAAARQVGVIGRGGKASDVAYSYGTATAGARQMDELNMREWLDQHVPGVSGEVKTFLDQAMSGWYGLDMAGLSALNWMDYLVIPYPGGDERWHVKHGNDQVPVLAAKALPAGTVQLESPLQALIKRSDGSIRATVRRQRPVPAGDRRSCHPDDPLDDPAGGRSGGRRLRQLPDDGDQGAGHGNGREADRAVPPAPGDVQGARQAVERHGQLHEPELPDLGQRADRTGQRGPDHGLRGRLRQQGVREPGYHAPAPEDLTATVLGQINQAVPGTRAQFNGKAWLDYWTGDPWTRGSYAAYPPGQLTKYWGYAGIPEGRVHFAGEHTSTYSQGFLNGGVESGQRAAIEVLLALGLPVPSGIASLPYSRIPGEHIGVGDRW